ncbi:MAG: electron transporter RnfD, partial [Acetatifactor sp.]|nr:electron transporter RnfD [Acetatifactor sp.]
YFTNYVGYFLDGKQGKFALMNDEREHVYQIARGLRPGKHELLLFKRQDSCHSFTFTGFLTEEDSKVYPCEPLPSRKIEFYGDSVTCGEVSEAISCVGKPDPENHDGLYSNSYYSYSWMTARKLNAEAHIIGQGGAALLDKLGWFHYPDFIGMESIYDKIQYNPELGETKQWDFKQWIPHVVVIAIGQNDANPVNFMEEDYDGPAAATWKRRYADFLRKLMSLYPSAHIVCTTTILNHSVEWDHAIDEVCQSMASKKVHHFLYSNNGCGTPGHIRIPEADKMAEELSAFINTLGVEW